MQKMAGKHPPEESQWYVMLFPSERETRRLCSAFEHLATQVGGIANPTPHATVGYFHGAVSPQAVVEQLRSLTSPAIAVHASGLFSWSEESHRLFGYTLSVRVQRDAHFQLWQRAARTSLASFPLQPTFMWEQQQPSMQILRHLPVPPQDALGQIADREFPVTFVAARVVVSQLIGGEILTWLAQSLRD